MWRDRDRDKETEFCYINSEELFLTSSVLKVNLALREDVKVTTLDTEILYLWLSSEVRQRECTFLM